MPYVHNPESAENILRTQLRKEMGVMETCHRFARSVIDEEQLQIRRPKERNMDLFTACLVNSCLGKDAGVFIRLNCALDVILVSF